MEYNNLVVGSHTIYNFTKDYINVLNDIFTFIDTTPPTNIITNETILTQYIIRQEIKVFCKKARLQYKNI